MYMKTTKLISLLLITSLFVSSFIFVSNPKKAEATMTVTDITALPLNILNTAQTIVGVAEEIVTAAQSTISAVQEVLGVTKEFALDTAGFIIAKTLLSQVSGGFLNYVNTGSDGNSVYIANLRNYVDDFQTETANSIIDETVSRLDYRGSEDLVAQLKREYAQPEGIQEELAKLLTVNFQYNDERIDDEGPSGRGNYGCEQGERLTGWFRIDFYAANPQCTRQGSYLITKTTVDKELERQKEEEYAQYVANQGFQSPKDSNGNVQTPGITVKDQLSSLVGSGQRQLEEADELNEIVGALVGKLTSQIAGGGLKSISGNDVGSENLNDYTEDTTGQTTYVPPDRDADQSVKNLAPDRKDFAEQSSQREDFRPENAADGFTGGNVDGGNGSIAETTRDGQLHPWWQIDLGKRESILFIKIFRRISGESAQGAIGTINVYISDTPFGTDRETLAPSAAKFTTKVMPEEGSLLIDVNKMGRYVRIQRSESTYTHLALAEAQIIQNPPPVLKLNGSAKVTFAARTEPYVDPGATAEDARDGDMTSRIVVTGEVDVSTPGTYTLKYTVEDLGGAKSEKTRTIIVTKSAESVREQYED